MNEELAPHTRDAVVRDWLARALGTYPFLGARSSGRPERFRDPVGHILGEAFPVLLDQLLGGRDDARAAAALEEVVKVRAVQDLTPKEAVGFVFLVKDALRHHAPETLTPALDQRVDRMALAAFDLLVKCRERMAEIQAGERKRSRFLLDRIAHRRSSE